MASTATMAASILKVMALLVSILRWVAIGEMFSGLQNYEHLRIFKPIAQNLALSKHHLLHIIAYFCAYLE
jgi:hypothetical protein